MSRSRTLPQNRILVAAFFTLACGGSLKDRGSAESAGGTPSDTTTAAGTTVTSATPTGALVGDTGRRSPNELGRIPVIEYHLIGDRDSRWGRERNRFRQDLELLYARGYRPVTMSQVVDRKIDLPAGLSPVVVTFDDASPGQFAYIERDGKLEIDPNSAVGIWLDFHAKHPDWGKSAVFCLLPAAREGHAFFGEKGIAGQKSEWRFQKVKFLAENGFELCNHTLWHAKLSQYPDAMVQEQIARGVLAIDSAVPGYRVRTFALPLGLWPKNRALAKRGSWTDPKTKRTITYDFDAVLEVSGGPTRGPFDPEFDQKPITRVEIFENELERTLNMLDRTGTRYVSDGDPRTVAKPVSSQR